MARPIEEPAEGQDKTFTFTLGFEDWRLLMQAIEKEEKDTGYRLSVSDMLRRVVREQLRTWKDR